MTKMNVLLLFLISLTAITQASTASKPKKSSWFNGFQRLQVDEELATQNAGNETKKNAMFRIFPVGEEKSKKEDSLSKDDPSRKNTKRNSRFGLKQGKASENDSSRSELEGKKMGESEWKKHSSSPNAMPMETSPSKDNNQEPETSSDPTNGEGASSGKPKRRMFLFRSGIQEKEKTESAPSKGGTADLPRQDENIDPKTIFYEEPDSSDSRSKDDGSVDRKVPKSMRLRFGIRVKESADETEKNATNIPPSNESSHPNQGPVAPNESKPIAIAEDISGNSSLTSDQNAGMEKNCVDSSVNATAVDKVPNETRSEAIVGTRTAPVAIHTPPTMFGGPVGYPMSPQQQPSGVIIMGLDGRGPRGHPPSQQHGQPTPTAAIIAEAIATVISTGIRFWFLNSLTHWFADEEFKSLKKPTQHFMWERLNDRYAKDSDALQSALRAPPTNVSERRWRHHVRRQLRKEQQLGLKKEQTVKTGFDDVFNRTVIIMDLKSEKGDFDLNHLEDVVTFILSEHRRKVFGVVNTTAVEIEVVVLVESPGGPVSEFGLGAAQIYRLTAEEGIATTVCVDKVAASGGYMIASQANKIVAAPFSVVGSIGVIREGLNFNKALQKYGISPMVLTAGDAKAPLSTFGEITKGGLEIAQKNLEKVHGAFRELVVRGRPELVQTIEVVADGDIFLGLEALDLKLVDEIMTSEEYILRRIQAGDRVLKLHKVPKFMKNRKLTSIHPLDFLKENGPKWFAQVDVPAMLSRVIQTSTVLKVVHHLVHNRIFY